MTTARLMWQYVGDRIPDPHGLYQLPSSSPNLEKHIGMEKK